MRTQLKTSMCGWARLSIMLAICFTISISHAGAYAPFVEGSNASNATPTNGEVPIESIPFQKDSSLSLESLGMRDQLIYQEGDNEIVETTVGAMRQALWYYIAYPKAIASLDAALEDYGKCRSTVSVLEAENGRQSTALRKLGTELAWTRAVAIGAGAGVVAVLIWSLVRSACQPRSAKG